MTSSDSTRRPAPPSVAEEARLPIQAPCCEEFEADLGALLSGDATREEMIRANRHLSECARCRDAHAGLAGFRGRFRDAYGLAPAAAQRGQGSLSKPRVDRRRLWTAAALAASVMVSVVVMESAPSMETTASETNLAESRGVSETVLEAGEDESSGAVANALPDDETALMDDLMIEEMTDEELEELLLAANVY